MGLLAAAVLLCTGCGSDPYVDALIKPDTESGRVWLNLYDDGPELVAQGRIDAHRRVNMADQTVIDTWILHPQGDQTSRGTVLLLHGIGSSKGSLLKTGRKLADRGLHVVLPDLRHHGRSGGEFVTYGWQESRDMKALMDALLDEGIVSAPIYAAGITLGGSTAIQYAALDARVAGVFAVAPYKDFHTLATRKMFLMLKRPILEPDEFEAIKERCGDKAGFPPEQSSSALAVQELTCPVVVAHGLVDVSVPVASARAVYRAADEPKDILLLDPLTMLVAWEDWVANQIDRMIQGSSD